MTTKLLQQPKACNVSCIVLCDDAAIREQVGKRLRLSKRIGHIENACDEQALRATLALAAGTIGLAIVVTPKHEPTLPACLLRYPDMRVLVLTKSRKKGELTNWLQQGATDVASLHKPDYVQHALGRLIDECVQQERFNQQRNEIQQLQARIEQIERDAEQRSQQQLLDSATALPSRRSLLDQFQNLLDREHSTRRYIAMLVSIHDSSQAGWDSAVLETVQDLMLYRAANNLQSNMHQHALLGRVASNSLLLIQPDSNNENSRDLANRTRTQLGTIDGLLDPTMLLHINTLTIPASTASAERVLQRLEARRPSSAEQPSDNSHVEPVAPNDAERAQSYTESFDLSIVEDINSSTIAVQH